MSRTQRQGFTLVELLVVIAIIGILVALLLPAIQSARQAGLRTKCRNNMRQMAIATQNYVDTNKAFPYGGTKPWPIRGSNKSWAFQILPFMEEAAVYGFSKLTNVDAAADLIEKSIIPSYTCPTRRQATQSFGQENRVLMDYCGVTPGVIPANGNVVYSENDYWIGGIFDIPTGKTKHYGVFVRKTGTGDGEKFTYLANQPCKAKQVSDGLSKTLMLTEKRLWANKYEIGSWHDDQGWADGWDPDTLRITSLAPEQDGRIEPTDDATLRRIGFQAGSAHPLSMSAVMADTATIGINYEIDVKVFNALGDRRDGLILPDSSNF